MKQHHVLIVDDDDAQRELLSEILTGTSDEFALTLASNGIEALNILRDHSFDAILLDKRMPILDGNQLCRLIREELGLKLLPIIMITGSNALDDLTASFQAGVSDFLRKPYSPVELIARLKSAIKNKRLTDELDSAETLLFTLARMVEAKDITTGDHCSRLAHMGMVFGKELGLAEEDINNLRRGGVMHDIGKLGIPDSILLKKGPLSDEEWVLMRKHTIIGAHLCESLASMRGVIPIILCHHERWDGSGYPHGLAGEDIPYLARIFQLLDIYDALASERPYKPAFPLDEIIRIIENETKQGWRDPDLVDAFLHILKSDHTRLYLPKSNVVSLDERAFHNIADTGVINWVHNIENFH